MSDKEDLETTDRNQALDSQLLLLEECVIPLLATDRRMEVLGTYSQISSDDYLFQPLSTSPAEVSIRRKVAKFLRSEGITLAFLREVECEYMAEERWIHINKQMQGWMRTLALLHESAHHVAGDVRSNNTSKNSADVAVAAEGTATTVMGVLGIDTTHYSSLKIAGIIINQNSAFTTNKAEVIKFNAPQIRRNSSKLLTVIG